MFLAQIKRLENSSCSCQLCFDHANACYVEPWLGISRNTTSLNICDVSIFVQDKINRHEN